MSVFAVLLFLPACGDDQQASPLDVAHEAALADARPDLMRDLLPQNIDCSLEARCACSSDSGFPRCNCYADSNPCCPLPSANTPVLACEVGSSRCAWFGDGCIPPDWRYFWPEAGMNSYLDGFGLEASASDAGPRDAAGDAQDF